MGLQGFSISPTIKGLYFFARLIIVNYGASLVPLYYNQDMSYNKNFKKMYMFNQHLMSIS